MTVTSAAAPPPDDEGPAAASSEGEPRPPAVVGWWRTLLPVILGAGLTLVTRSDPALVEERYARGLYPLIASIVARIGSAWEGIVPSAGLDAARPSLAEVTVVLGVLFLGSRAWRALRTGPLELLRLSIRTVASLYLAFLLLWGLNHARQPLAVTLDLEMGPVAAAELGELAGELAASLATELEQLEGRLADRDFAVLAARAWAEQIQREPTLGWCDSPRVRAPLLSRALTAGGISGIFGPHTQECHVAAGLPPVDRGFVACHEIAHAQGWAREDEANYLAWRVGSRSDVPALRVSALTLALVHVHGALRRADPALQRELALALDPAIVALIEKRTVFWRGARVEQATRVATAVNDTYLRSQGQAGVASYGRMVDLLVAERRARGGPADGTERR